MPRPFVIWPDRRLTTPADPVDAITDEIRALWDEMLAAMYSMPGVGLAAPQLGVGLRVAVVDASDTHDSPIRMANPELVSASVTTRSWPEGSPNLPGLFAEVVRPEKVTVRYLDEAGQPIEREFDGLWATSVQHQIDHLNGKLFVDRLKPVKRKMMLARHAKRQRKG